MKKNIKILVTGLAMTGLFAACTSNVDLPGTAPETTEATTEAASEEVTEEEVTEEPETTETTEFVPDEASGDEEKEVKDNPFEYYEGVYYCDLANIDVRPDGKDGAKVTVVWGNGINESSEWKMDITWNDDLWFSYENCVKKTSTYSEEAELEEEKVNYEDGTGSFTFGDNEITWSDDKENIAAGMKFEKQGVIAAPDEAGE